MSIHPFEYVRAAEVERGHIIVVDAMREALDRRRVTKVETFKGHTRVYSGRWSITFKANETVPVERPNLWNLNPMAAIDPTDEPPVPLGDGDAVTARAGYPGVFVDAVDHERIEVRVVDVHYVDPAEKWGLIVVEVDEPA